MDRRKFFRNAGAGAAGSVLFARVLRSAGSISDEELTDWEDAEWEANTAPAQPPREIPEDAEEYWAYLLRADETLPSAPQMLIRPYYIKDYIGRAGVHLCRPESFMARWEARPSFFNPDAIELVAYTDPVWVALGNGTNHMVCGAAITDSKGKLICKMLLAETSTNGGDLTLMFDASVVMRSI